MRRGLLPVIGTLLVLNGCSLAPKYARPEMPVPSAWPSPPAMSEGTAGAGAAPAAAASAPAPTPAQLPWREFITDTRLQAVVDLALANNRDLKMAALTVEKAQAAYRIQRAALYPGVGAAASADLYRVPKAMAGNGDSRTSQQYLVGVGMSSWEVDFFGRIRSLKEAALDQYLATEQARRSAQTSIIAVVAETYLALAADSENLRLARSTQEAQQASMELIERSRNAGVASDLDLSQARSLVQAARADVARFSGAIEVDRHALDVLAGKPVPADLLPETLTVVGALKPVSPGLPSEVLLRRPDIMAAEFQLKAANANIGAARAAFFPTISLTSSSGFTGLGFMSSDLGKLFEFGSRTWMFAPQVVTPIFTSGSLKANVEVSKINRDLAVAQYEKTIETAFREVSDALTLRTTLAAQKDAQAELVTSLGTIHTLSDARYKAGVDSYLSVLVAQRSLFAAQQGLVAVRLAEQENLVTLYKVLGGGV